MAVNAIQLGPMDRGGLSGSSTTSHPLLAGAGGDASFNQYMGGFVVNAGGNGEISWKNMQPSGGANDGTQALSGSGINAINTAAQTCRAYNTSIGNPAQGVGPPFKWTFKLRIICGNDSNGVEHQPSWVGTSTGVTITSTTSKFSPAVTQAPFYSTASHTASYRTIFQNFLAKLALYVPTGETLALAESDLLGEIAFGGGIGGEPFLATAYGWSTSTLAGATTANYEAGITNLVADTCAAFPNTPVSVAFNNPPQIYGTTAWMLGTFGGFATGFMDSFVANGPIGTTVLENNSMFAVASAGSSSIGVNGPFTNNDPNTHAPWFISNTTFYDGHDGSHPGVMSALYTAMGNNGPGIFAKQVGGSYATSPYPICIQTDTWIKNGSSVTAYEATLSYAVAIGARSVELASGYNALGAAALLPYWGANASGTATSMVGSVLHDTTQTWGTGQFIGYTITCGTKTGVITANTANTVTATWSPSAPTGTPAYSINYGFLANSLLSSTSPPVGSPAFDQGGTATGTTSPNTVTATGADGGTGRAIISVTATRTSGAGTDTFADSYSGSGTATTLADTGATSQASHHHSSYSLDATTGSTADSNTVSWGMTTNEVAQCIASYTTDAFVGKSAQVTGSTTLTPTYGSAVAGNTLVMCVTGHSSTGASFTCSDANWRQRKNIVASALEVCEIWDKLAVGSDTMPTWTLTNGTQACGAVVELQTGSTPPASLFDHGGTNTGTTLPNTVTSSGTDTYTGDLIISVTAIRASGAGQFTVAPAHTFSGSGTANTLGDNTTTVSQASHHTSSYTTNATTGGSADSDAVGVGTGVTAQHVAQAIASYTTDVFVGKSALATDTTTIAPTYSGAVAGNLLVCCLTGHAAGANFTCSDSTWTAREQVVAASLEVAEIWDKVAVGSDSMPTWTLTSGSQTAGIVGEFSSSATAPTAAPVIGTTTLSTYTLTANWTDISVGNDGGAPISGYTATCYRAADNSVFGTSTVGPSATSATFTVSGFGVGYYCKVYGTNVKGNSAYSSASNTVTTATPTAPTAAPVIGTASIAGSTATPTWTDISTGNNGGSPITGYGVNTYTAVGNVFVGTSFAGASATSLAIPLGGNSVGYYFEVFGFNAYGNSSLSSASNTVTTPAQGTAFPPPIGQLGHATTNHIFP